MHLVAGVVQAFEQLWVPGHRDDIIATERNGRSVHVSESAGATNGAVKTQGFMKRF